MDIKDLIIFQSAEEEPISKDEAEHLRRPYEQQIQMIKSLTACTKNAANQLVNYGYGPDAIETKKVIFTKQLLNSDWDGKNDDDRYFILYLFPGPIPEDANAEERAACYVLKLSENLWTAIFQADNLLVANLGIQLGFALAMAHATPFEPIAKIGKRRKEIPVEAGIKSGRLRTQERQLEWERWKAEAERIKEKNPRLSKKKIAEFVKSKLSLTEKTETIRKRI